MNGESPLSVFALPPTLKVVAGNNWTHLSAYFLHIRKSRVIYLIKPLCFATSFYSHFCHIVYFLKTECHRFRRVYNSRRFYSSSPHLLRNMRTNHVGKRKAQCSKFAEKCTVSRKYFRTSISCCEKDRGKTFLHKTKIYVVGTWEELQSEKFPPPP